jgi:hypothetical protein
MKLVQIQIFFLFLISISGFSQGKTFSNPLMISGADPYGTYHEGTLYRNNEVDLINKFNED